MKCFTDMQPINSNVFHCSTFFFKCVNLDIFTYYTFSSRCSNRLHYFNSNKDVFNSLLKTLFSNNLKSKTLLHTLVSCRDITSLLVLVSNNRELFYFNPSDLPCWRNAINWICGIEKHEEPVLSEEEKRIIEEKQTSLYEVPKWKKICDANAIMLMFVAIFLWAFFY